jgi:predicted DNA-binding protein
MASRIYKKRPPRPQGARIGLTVPPELDRVLARIAAATGTGKATFVREWLCEAVPQLDQLANAMELAKRGNTDAFDVMAKVMLGVTEGADQLTLDIKKTRRRVIRKKRLEA